MTGQGVTGRGGVERSDEPARGMARGMARVVSRGRSWFLDYRYAVAVQGGQLAAQGRRLAGRLHPEDLTSGTLAPVVLLPGVYETWTFLAPVARALHDAGHPVHAVPGLGINRLPDVDGARIAAELLEERDLHDVVLVAHSKGGLIGKRMMVREGEPRRIRGLVAVNTPFGGSRYASYLVGRTLRAFAPNNVDLLDLAAQADANERITSVYAEFDPHIPEKSALAGATNIELPLAGHFRPLADPLLIDTVVEAVARTATRPAP